MKERPILFSGAMVRALLDGRKTQTRRIVKLDIPTDADEVFFWSGEAARAAGHRNVAETGLWARRNGRDGYLRFLGPCRYGQPGDRLWVRETCRAEELADGQDGVRFSADEGFLPIENTPGAAIRWLELYNYDFDRRHRTGTNVPGIHMPRWASRLTLEITEVRFERLQDISEADAIAEGVVSGATYGGRVETWLPTEDDRSVFYPSPRDAYAALWERINGPDSWAANPWVWIVTFGVAA